jgi:hypothetical protein
MLPVDELGGWGEKQVELTKSDLFQSALIHLVA